MSVLSSTPAFCGKIKLEGFTHAQVLDKDNNVIKDREKLGNILSGLSPEARIIEDYPKSSKTENGFVQLENSTLDTKAVNEIDNEKFTVKTADGYKAYLYHSNPYHGIADYNQVLNAYAAASQGDITVSVKHNNEKTRWG